jgi:hypothetical protein
MNNKLALTIMALGLALPAANLNAQDGPRPPRGPRGNGPEGRRGGPPIVAALDLNKDGVIDASEINAAAQSLAKLDKNSDGKLTPDEFHGGPGPRPRPAGDGNDGAPNPDDPAKPHRPAPPLAGALDANHDGVIDAAELANAAAALKALDKNSDGEITREEIGGPRGPRGGGPERRGGKKRHETAPEE